MLPNFMKQKISIFQVTFSSLYKLLISFFFLNFEVPFLLQIITQLLSIIQLLYMTDSIGCVFNVHVFRHIGLFNSLSFVIICWTCRLQYPYTLFLPYSY